MGLSFRSFPLLMIQVSDPVFFKLAYLEGILKRKVLKSSGHCWGNQWGTNEIAPDQVPSTRSKNDS